MRKLPNECAIYSFIINYSNFYYIYCYCIIGSSYLPQCFTAFSDGGHTGNRSHEIIQVRVESLCIGTGLCWR